MEPLDPELVTALLGPDAYPADARAGEGIAHVQTHLSHVFLLRERVYKLHKSVRFPFVDFSTRSLRNADSLRELRLNRRLAPEVYLGLAAVTRGAAGVRVGALREELEPAGAGGASAEHAVVMKRLTAGRDAQSLLARGELAAEHVDAVAARIADFHAAHGLGAPAPFSGAEWRDRVLAPVRETFADLVASPPLAARATAALARAGAIAAEQWTRFEARRISGRIVDGHGDLHLQHVWFERPGEPPLMIDCLEFRDDYRQIDAAAEVAFLAMDLAYRGRRDLAERFLRRYAEASDDFDLYGVVDFFAAYRAAVRAKVASLAARDADLPGEQRRLAAESADRHLSLAERALAPRAPGAVVAVGGIVGTGKSTVAAALADATGGAVISSDRVRKRQAGLAPTARGDAELYGAERTRRTYAGLLERALPVVRSGRPALLDATWASVRLRAPLRAFAAEHGLRAFFVETVCAASVARERLAARARAGTDPSDAGPDRYEPSAAGFEPPREWPAAARAQIATDHRSWRGDVESLARRFGIDLA